MTWPLPDSKYYVSKLVGTSVTKLLIRFALFSLHCLKWLLVIFVVLTAFIFQDSVQKLNMDMHITIYIWIWISISLFTHTHTHTHAHIYIYIYQELSVHSHLIWLPYLICMHSVWCMTYQLPKCCIIFGVLRDLITNFEFLETKTLN